MLKFRFSYLMLASVLGLAACGGEDDRSISNPNPPTPTPEARTKVVFHPAFGQLPVPSDIQFATQVPADGTMSAGVDPANPVVTGIDFLDGNSVLAPFDIAFDGALDDTQTLDARSFIATEAGVIPNPAQNVFLLPLEFPSGDALSQAKDSAGSSVEVPTFALAARYAALVPAAMSGDIGAAQALAALAQPTARADIISLDGGTNNVIRINPLRPLTPKTKYLVVLTNILDAGGNPVLPSDAYNDLTNTDPDAPIFNRALQRTILSWETLAAGYFGFMQTVYSQAAPTLSAPSAADIILAMTFTTGGTTDVLEAIAAPETFFQDSLTASYKKDAIVKTVSGAYTLQGEATASDASETDQTIAATLNALLTAIDSPLYNAQIAAAVGAGANYATVAATGASAAYLVQRAAAEAAVQVRNVNATATGTVSAIVAGVSAAAGNSLPVSAVFPVPAARASTFYRVDAMPPLSESLTVPAMLYQGHITLPYFQEAPTETDGSAMVTSHWTANTTIGAAIDAGSGAAAGTTPPSAMVTYRYPFPSKQTDVTVPVIAITPNTEALGAIGLAKPEDGWPVIIFVHGITTDRSAAIPMARFLANACVDTSTTPPSIRPGVPCFATIAIDQPLHGVAPAGSIVPGLTSVSTPGLDLSALANIGDNLPSDNLSERHFNFTAAADGRTPTAMNYEANTGSSGSLFINLTSFPTVRDNLRQMTVDLLNLNASLATMDLDDDGETNDLDTGNVYFIGHSLGAIDGLPFVAINNSSAVQSSTFSDLPMVKAAVGLKTGGGVVRLLTNSPSFAVRILGGLALANSALQQGNSGLEAYMNVFQGVVDSADVMNFASTLSDANSTTGVLLTEVIGDGTETYPADQTIPNSADDELWDFGAPANFTDPTSGFQVTQLPAPLAGTEPLIAQFGAVPTASVSASDGDAAVITTRFTQGTHGTPISVDNPRVFQEMVSEIVTFFAFGGDVSGSIVTDAGVVETLE